MILQQVCTLWAMNTLRKRYKDTVVGGGKVTGYRLPVMEKNRSKWAIF